MFVVAKFIEDVNLLRREVAKTVVCKESLTEAFSESRAMDKSNQIRMLVTRLKDLRRNRDQMLERALLQFQRLYDQTTNLAQMDNPAFLRLIMSINLCERMLFQAVQMTGERSFLKKSKPTKADCPDITGYSSDTIDGKLLQKRRRPPSSS
eukprot:TRINITY_DN3061_c0_g2_i2.p1 TRINITY_DN3061_c0_g2~~TRINITY_DN3061_c0_g2_i2.p1  ORF type:complete len:151 (-),score=19.43 TRINITY_DN3061_c0_g2_i2:246-698(-)